MHRAVYFHCTVFENGVLRRMLGPKAGEAQEEAGLRELVGKCALHSSGLGWDQWLVDVNTIINLRIVFKAR
jgi:hypothetical protein